LNTISEYNKSVIGSLFLRVSLTTVIFMILLASCGSDSNEKLHKMIDTSSQDSKIEESEWTSIKKEISEMKFSSWADSLKEDTALKSYIEKRHAQTQERGPRRGPKKELKFVFTIFEAVEELNEINIFIENSKSIDGYVNYEDSSNHFKDNLYKIHSRSKTISEKPINRNIAFICEGAPIRSDQSINEALKKNGDFFKPQGGRLSTDLNLIIKKVIESTNEQTISVLVSDFIYSSTEDLWEARQTTHEVFLNKLQSQPDFVTVIFKFTSRFTGKYYPEEIQLDAQKRPYYIWLFGDREQVNKFREEVKLKELEGYENLFYLSATSAKKSPLYSVLFHTDKKGLFQTVPRGNYRSLEIKDCVKDKNSEFEFSLALNLNEIRSSRKEDKDAYKLSNGYQLLELKKFEIGELHQVDKAYWSKHPDSFSHIMRISFDGGQDFADLNISLPKKIPKWVSESSTEVARVPPKKDNTTFGFNTLVEKCVFGAYKDFKKWDSNHINVKISISE
jgi:hypothetical protein